ncbi:phytanoyl-CoA dioxygenase family protein [Gammaproteobacteria bacterium]|nr:phytanoyl-CoA dioxygenase family protein [Gammaproteobacteria bacterium]
MNYDISQFRKEGYLIVKNFLDKEEHEELNRTCNTLTNYAKTISAHTQENWLMNSPNNPMMLQGAMQKHDTFKKLGRNTKLLRVARTLLRTNHLSTYISKFFPMIPKEGKSVDWHQDNYYIEANPDKLISCDVFINGARKDNGCLRIVKNSHKHDIFDHKIQSHQEWINWIDLKAGLDIIDLELDEPFAVFFHPNLIHGCYENKSQDYRYSVAWEYMKWPYIPPKHNDHISNDLIQV